MVHVIGHICSIMQVDKGEFASYVSYIGVLLFAVCCLVIDAIFVRRNTQREGDEM